MDNNQYSYQDQQQGSQNQLPSLMQLQMKFKDLESFYLTVSPEYTIKQIKQLIASKMILSCNQLKLFDDKKNISQYKVNSENGKAKIDVQIIGQKGGINFQMNDLTKKKSKSFSNRAPAYRRVKKGISFHAKCQNKNCEAGKNSKQVIVNMGFGKFNIAVEVNKCKCPMCGEQTQPAYNFGYYKSKINISGKRVNEKSKCEFQETANDNTYHTFQNNKEMGRWNFLEVVVTQLS